MYSVKLVKDLEKYDMIVTDNDKQMVIEFFPKATDLEEYHKDFGCPVILYCWRYGKKVSHKTWEKYPVVYL